MTASDIVHALSLRHSEDVSMAELTLGLGGSPRMDYWALKRSWSPITSIGYEIKISRADFMGDDKWPTYRDAVHQFYFACPWDLIKADEVADGVGIMWLNKGGKLITKRKAKRRDPDPKLYEKALVRGAWGKWGQQNSLASMSRLQRAEHHAKRIKAAEIGHQTALVLGHKSYETWSEIDRRLRKSEEQAVELKQLKDWCATNGIDTDRKFDSQWSQGDMKSQINRLFSGMNEQTLNDLQRLNTGLSALIKSGSKYRDDEESAA